MRYAPGRQAKDTPASIEIRLNNALLPEVQTIRILGMYLQINGKNATTPGKLTASVHQANCPIHRIANKHKGMKQIDITRLVQVFVLSPFVYPLPYIS